MITDEQLREWKDALKNRYNRGQREGDDYYDRFCIAVAEVERMRAIVRDMAAIGECYEDTDGHCGCHYTLDELKRRAVKATK